MQQLSNDLPFEVTDVFWQIMSVWDNYDTLILQGGTSSSKTYSIEQVLGLISSRSKYMTTITGQDLPNLRSGALRDFENILDTSPLIAASLAKPFNKTLMTYTFKSGSQMEFKSFKDAQDAKSGKRDILFVNEANGVAKSVYDELEVRTRYKRILDFNATARFWAHDLELSDSKAIRLLSNYKHNRFCPPKIKQRILSYKTQNPYRWKVYGLGMTGTADGMIYPSMEFINPDKLPCEWDEMSLVGGFLDYGYANDPLAMGKCGFYNGRIYAGLFMYGTGFKLSEIAECLEEEMEIGSLPISMDDSNAKEQGDLLRQDYGFNVWTANRRSGAINQGISLLQEYPISVVDYTSGFYEPGVSNAATEWENYIWKKVRGETKPQPIEKFNHFMDGIRYWGLDSLTEPNEIEDNQSTEVITI